MQKENLILVVIGSADAVALTLYMSQKLMELNLKKMEDLLEKFATAPVPNYMGFLQAIQEEGYWQLRPHNLADIIAKGLNKYERLIAEDERRGNASEEGFKAFLRYKLLIRFLISSSPRMQGLIEDFQSGAFEKAIDLST
ncbi:MAG: hypothetical protein OXU36_25540 [Candidatus Poribacteria bacterium]|nr:hypothetical protein [Candidatus Poribacteria bacterium]